MGMSISHTVQQGEHISRIAKQYGYRDYRIIWDAPENADLRKERDNPNVLYPGDTLVIPDKEEKKEQRATGQVHVFQVPAPRLKLRIALKDYDNLPIANERCLLEVAGKTQSLETDGSGILETEIPADAEMGKLTIPNLDIETPVEIGHLDPVEEESGVAARLINLGYFDPSGDTKVDTLRLRYAIEMFQRDFGLKVSGELDSATRAKLREAHGC